MIGDLCRAAQEVGARLLEWREARLFDGRWEGTQFKARVDRLAHQLWTDRLKDIAPELPIVSEEDSGEPGKPPPGRYWLIDPIDGTASFVGGYDGFVTQAALMADHRPVLAVVFAPALGIIYSAERFKGAFRNGEPMHLSGRSEWTTLIDNYPEPRGVTRAAYEALGFRRYLESGSIGLKICRVAEGAADLFFKNVPVREWDLAAPQLVLEEAGGVLSDINGEHVRFDEMTDYQGVVASPSREGLRRLVSWYQASVEDCATR